jgi:pimeloyl-ACP methyl ester carboxylesterase
MRDSGVQKPVVLVHGLWFRRWALAYLARRLRKAGFRTKGFNYATTTQDLGRQVEKLYRFASMPDGAMPHFVGHSMGGLLTLQLLDRHPQTPSGRIVLLGSPIRGSSVARQISAWPGGRSLLGEAENTLVEGIRSWPLRREIGMIAGSRALGLGVLAGGARSHGDGTVLAEESRHDALDDRIELPVTHTGMLFSAEVARQVASFLRQGRFDHVR